MLCLKMGGQCPNVCPLGWLFIITLRLRLSSLEILRTNLSGQLHAVYGSQGTQVFIILLGNKSVFRYHAAA